MGGDEAMAVHSAPFRFTETGSVLIRTGGHQLQPQSATTSNTSHVRAICSCVYVHLSIYTEWQSKLITGHTRDVCYIL